MSSRPPPSSPDDSAELGSASESSAPDSLLRDAAFIPDRSADADPSARSGRLGHYLLGERIGRGGMGEVYEATDTRLGRKVALKVLPPSFAASEERRRRFLREARSASAVSHPHITVVYDVGEDAGTVFIAMELLSGSTLREVLRRREALGVAESLHIARDVARGLAKAHEAGIVHRDLKPENLMINADGLVKILDFGLAKALRAPGEALEGGAESTTELVTVEGHLLGTPSYMSPEQAVGAPLDHRTDVFSLGVILYELLSGDRPFTATTTVGVLIRIARDEPTPLSQVCPWVPAAVEAIVTRCLAKRPEDRFASCAELIAAIDAAAIGVASDPRADRRSPPKPPLPAARPSEALQRAPSESSASSRAKGPPAEPVEPSGAPQANKPRPRWLLLTAGAATLGAIAAGSIGLLNRAPAPSPEVSGSSPAAPIPVAPDVVGCPPLDVKPASAGPWLGAAVAQLVCDRVTILLGGKFSRTLAPAALLDLPRSPTSSFPADPFAEPGARERALAAARARAARWIRGEVEPSEAGYRVRLVLESASGVIAERDGRAEDIVMAARAATAALAQTGALGAQAEVDPSVADWVGTTRVSELLAWRDVEEDENRGMLMPEGTCRDVDRIAAAAGALGPLVRTECALVAEDASAGRLAPLPVDASTPGNLSRTARYHRVSGGATDPGGLAMDLRRAFDAAADPLGRAVLSAAEAEMWLFAGEPEKARQRALVAVQAEPRATLGWRALQNASGGEPGFQAVVRASAAWHPDTPWAVRWLPPAGEPGESTAQARAKRLEHARRLHTLAPQQVNLVRLLGEELLRSGEREEVRALAARHSSGMSEERDVAELLMLLVEGSLARFSAAYERGRRALEASALLGHSTVHFALLRRTMAVAGLLDRKRELADALVQRFIDPEPRLDRMNATPAMAVTLCALATRRVSDRCFRQLDRLLADGHFVALVPNAVAALKGARRLARGDHAGAAAAWRPIASESSPPTDLLADLLADTFDRQGDLALAELVDQRVMQDAEALNGATMAHVRAARRAARRGDRATARALAEVAVRAWSASDVAPAVLREMRALAGGP